MVTHVDTARSEMFRESCDEVRNRLLDMCKYVEQSMSLQTDDIFVKMQRDYMQVVSGTQLPKGQMMPKQERNMRSQVAEVIEAFDKANAEAVAAEDAAKSDVVEEQERVVDSSANHPLVTKKEHSENSPGASLEKSKNADAPQLSMTSQNINATVEDGDMGME